MDAVPLKLGKYRHFEGKEYEVIAIAKDSETLEEMVVYRSLYENPEFGFGAVWVRPLSMFTEIVVVDGVETTRFIYVGE